MAVEYTSKDVKRGRSTAPVQTIQHPDMRDVLYVPVRITSEMSCQTVSTCDAQTQTDEPTPLLPTLLIPTINHQPAYSPNDRPTPVPEPSNSVIDVNTSLIASH